MIRQGPSPQIRDFISQYGSYDIVFMNVCRNPIKEYISKAINILTLGKAKEKMKELHYDKLFHLYLLISLEKNENLINIRLEKNEVVKIHKIILSCESDCKMVNIPMQNKINFTVFLNNEIQQQGRSFWLYDAISNNCQVFIMTLLTANKLGNSEIYTFVKQDISTLLSSPLKKAFRFITDLAARFDFIKYGKGLF